MTREILFLRPFWDADLTASQLKVIAHTIRGIGTLVAIQNGSESTQLREVTKNNRWGRYCAPLARLYSRIAPQLNVQLIGAPSDTWQERVVPHIRRSDAVIVHLAPRRGPAFREFPKLEPNEVPELAFVDALHNPVHETGTGQGVLREFEFCKGADALHKVVVLIPYHFHRRVEETARLLRRSLSVPLIKRSDAGFVNLSVRVSTLDQVVADLDRVRSIVVYHKFGGPVFHYRLRRAVMSCLDSRKPVTSSQSPQQVGIPAEPIPLPPDGKLKRVRYTPLQFLAKLPRHEVVEVSREEARRMRPGKTDDLFRCQSCGHPATDVFLFQYGLQPNLSVHATIYLKCQYCGYYDNR